MTVGRTDQMPALHLTTLLLPKGHDSADSPTLTEPDMCLLPAGAASAPPHAPCGYKTQDTVWGLKDQ